MKDSGEKNTVSTSTRETLIGLAVVILVPCAVVATCTSKSGSDAKPPKAAAPAVEKKPTQSAATAREARNYMLKLDTALSDGDRLITSGAHPEEVARHTSGMRDLAAAGRRFGDTVMDRPFGLCFGAGFQALAAWQTAVHTGKTPTPSGGQARAQYIDARNACLEVAAGT